MTDAKKHTLHEDVLALSTKIGAGLTVDTKASTMKAAEGLYAGNLPEGITMDAVKAVSDYNTTFVAAGAHAFGLASIEAMKSHKNVEKLTVDIPMGVKDNVSYTAEREKQVPNRFGNGEPITKHCAVTATYEVRAGKNGGQLKAARQLINELATAALVK